MLFTAEMNDIFVIEIDLFAEADVAGTKYREFLTAQKYLLTFRGSNEGSIGTLIRNNELATPMFQF